MYSRILASFLLAIYFVSQVSATQRTKTVYFDDNGYQCKGDCERKGSSYYWCDRVSGSWGYCGKHRQTKRCVGGGRSLTETITFHSKLFSYAGEWGPQEFCNEDQFVVGVQLFGEVDLGLTGIALFCSSNFTVPSDVCIVSSHMYFPAANVQHQTSYCATGNYAVGFQVMEQPSQGAGNDRSVTNFKITCSDGIQVHFDLPYPGDSWENEVTCKKGTAICGIRAKVETTHRDDNVGLHSLDIYCCTIKTAELVKLAKSCEAGYKWELFHSCDNRARSIPLQRCHKSTKTIEAKADIMRKLKASSQTYTKEQLASIEAEFDSNSLPGTPKQILRTKFEAKFGQGTTELSEHETSIMESLGKEVEHTADEPVPARQEIFFYKLVGNCGVFSLDVSQLKVTSSAMSDLNYYPSAPELHNSSHLDGSDVAISTPSNSNSPPPEFGSKWFAQAGIVSGVLLGIGVGLILVWFCRRQKRNARGENHHLDNEGAELELNPKH